MLTEVVVRGAKPQAAAFKLADSSGLVLHVAPTGKKTWRWRFRVNGRETTLVLGTYPKMALAQARLERDRLQIVRQSGDDPRAVFKAKAATFEHAALAWHALRSKDWSQQTARDVLGSFDRDVFPALGTMPLDQISARNVLEVVRAVEDRGHINTAHRIARDVNRALRFAWAQGWIEKSCGNITEAMRRVPSPRHHRALTDAVDLRALLTEMDSAVGSPSVKLAAHLLALTGVRFSSLRGARWGEIERMDDGEPLWRVPALRMKQSVDKKRCSSNDHLIPLSGEAIIILHAARRPAVSRNLPVDGKALIFTGDGGGLIGEKSIENLHKRTSFADRHTPHGWRASFSTILNGEMPEAGIAISQALAHSTNCKKARKIAESFERAYNRSVNLLERRRLFVRWGEILAVDAMQKR